MLYPTDGAVVGFLSLFCAPIVAGRLQCIVVQVPAGIERVPLFAMCSLVCIMRLWLRAHCPTFPNP